MLGLASAFLAAVMTDRAFLIAWPGQEGMQLHHFFRSDFIDWRVTDEVMERLMACHNQNPTGKFLGARIQK